MQRAEQESLACDLFVAIGSSLVVYPAAGLPILAGPSGGYKAVFIRRKDHVSAGLTYAVQFSCDLIQWTPSGLGLQVETGAGSSGAYEAVSVPFPAQVPLQAGGTDTPKFFRVSIDMGP